MNTEITDINVRTVGTLFYDADCGFCSKWVARIERSLRARSFRLAPLASRESTAIVRDEMILEFTDGRHRGGVDVIVALGSYIWWLRPIQVLSAIPGVLSLMRAGYRFIAARRHRMSGACRVRPARSGWLPLAVLPFLVIASRNVLADWVFMWVLAFAIFFGFKWLTWRRAGSSSVMRSLLYLLAWPGMDAKEFLTGTYSGRVQRSDWLRASTRTVLGAVLLGFAALGNTASPFVMAWTGMAGAILSLHFGVFELLALTYRRAGIPAKPLMLRPALSASVSDFWANRWNTSFKKLAHDLFFRPLARRTGAARATLLVFVLSGAIHDLVISLPARGGYGLPTAYFMLQGVAVLLEKSRAGAVLGVRSGLRGRAFMFVVTAVPAAVLFHPAFIRNIILPMLQAIGGYWRAL